MDQGGGGEQRTRLAERSDPEWLHPHQGRCGGFDSHSGTTEVPSSNGTEVPNEGQ